MNENNGPMNAPSSPSHPFMQDTCIAYVMMRILDTPFWGIFNLLPFILYKDLGASPFQLGIVIALKPLVAILSSYWSAYISKFPAHFVFSITTGRWIAFIPFIAFPFIDNPWYMIVCLGLFMFLQVGMMPAWMEILHQNLPKKTKEKVFSYSQAFGYLGGGLLPFALGWILDEWTDAWRWVFMITSLIAMSAHFLLRNLQMTARPVALTSPPPSSHPLLLPWKNAWQLLQRRPDFAKFQIGFMLIGTGLMIIQPALPVFFVDQLHLSYVEMGVAITLCKGIAFACSSPFWVKWIHQVNIFRFGSIIALLAALFPLFLLAAQIENIWLYIAYLTYGWMQAGNELSWNLSGPLFSKQEESSPYSSVNIMAVGIRGIFIPMIGAFFLAEAGPTIVIVMSGIFSFFASVRMATYNLSISESLQKG